MDEKNELNLPEFLVNMLNNQYGESIAKQIINGFEAKRFVTLRVNTLKSNSQKIAQYLNELSIEYEIVIWHKDAFILKNVSEKEIEKLDIYENGEIYLQSLSSMIPPIVLNPKEGEDILDMTAAPGGKTTQIAALTSNKAHITACEMNPIRADRLRYNIAKQGASCAYVMQCDSRNINDLFSFDRILLDAPCSGSGTLDINDNALKSQFTEKLLNKCIKSQENLLKKAIKILKLGSEMVYSTCSILQQENEEIINKMLKNGNIEILPIEIENSSDIPLLPTKIKGTLCVCPNEFYEGFFIAKIRKIKYN